MYQKCFPHIHQLHATYLILHIDFDTSVRVNWRQNINTNVVKVKVGIIRDAVTALT